MTVVDMLDAIVWLKSELKFMKLNRDPIYETSEDSLEINLRKSCDKFERNLRSAKEKKKYIAVYIKPSN